jgi:RecB family endonuclease NucS
VAYGQSLEEGLVTLKPETKFYQEVKQNFKNFHLTRIENISIPGVPDLLCYNKNHTFFTIELKVTKSKKIIFSPHQS